VHRHCHRAHPPQRRHVGRYQVGQPLDPANKNLTAWMERMKARPSAAA